MTDLIPKRWQNYLEKGKNCSSLQPNEWKDPQVLFYLLQRFKSLTGRDFALQYSKAPTSSPELHFIKSLKAMLATTNGSILKEYIDWVFDQKLKDGKVQLRTFNFLNVPALANEFLAFRHKAKKIIRSTPLPEGWRRQAEEHQIEAETYGDLLFIKLALQEGTADSSYRDFFDGLVEDGLQINLLEKL